MYDILLQRRGFSSWIWRASKRASTTAFTGSDELESFVCRAGFDKVYVLGDRSYSQLQAC